MARPRKYETPEEMQKVIDTYFAGVTGEVGPTSPAWTPTICGLALALGFTSRNALLAYEGYSEEFFGTVKRAKLQIEQWYERHLLTGNHVAGAIFALKNFNWRDDKNVNLGGQADNPIQIMMFGEDGTDTK